ncbi:sugar transferase [Pseudobacteroides cellulosolvens]|uniref:Undecaprenyl-phosphate galactose phosphotransferase n=1 Tax=Pseudobacteroides cellulosolvens ATCC 35603 = DSM 2933 TaxID=398512 RepID=A0A0L6JVG9_9FIRM|nr:sugar transferase [Pseudobacteroides cellulosolvens]KNY29640.1 Undecaprenyl-phosphate galactose phosphotransferase [Pseudobacteroides cellulosolvens ATCC 35603 = DSM 2933]
MKRIFDFLFSIAAIVVLSPILLVLALIVKFTSKGPVIFSQRRIGKDKKEFDIYKFRSMYVDTPKDVPTHLLDKPDAFITPVGKFLRKTSLDELPQLFNILKGEMSFVGPRPALYNQYDLVELRDNVKANSIRPGITGWAQINGRDELPIPVKVEYDRYYVEKMSLFLDVKIILKTFTSVLLSKGVVEGKQEEVKEKEHINV